nr:hypothetical protein [Colwellia sp. PAMC 20917]
MFVVVNRNTVVTLDGSFTRRHFGAVVIGDIAFNGVALTTYFIFVT